MACVLIALLLVPLTFPPRPAHKLSPLNHDVTKIKSSIHVELPLYLSHLLKAVNDNSNDWLYSILWLLFC